jgi:hypothetical protein
MKRIVLVWIVLAVFAGLVIAAPPPAILKISLPFQGITALAVLDARPDVIKGDRKDTFVGLSRSLYGIPYPVYTTSKKPLAEDFSDLVSRALKLGHTPAKVIKTTPYSGRSGAIKALQASGAERLILIEIRDWWFDSLIHTDLHYDLALTVLNAQGQELGSSALVGNDSVGGRQRPERRDIPTANNDIFTNLFAATAVVASFSPDAAPTAKPAVCTVEQILKMKDAGLTEDQIKAACGSTSSPSVAPVHEPG